MCNDYKARIELVSIEKVFAELGIPLLYPEGRPNLEPRDDVRITDRAPMLRAATGAAAGVELVQRRWSWPGRNGKPVYNFRSEGREFASGRCAIVADGFYEFTTHSDPKSKRKHKWLFTWGEREWFGIAGLWRTDAAVGEAFTMLTAEPGPDVAPYHDRQIVLLAPEQCARWLDPQVPASEILRPLPAGSLQVEQLC